MRAVVLSSILLAAVSVAASPRPVRPAAVPVSAPSELRARAALELRTDLGLSPEDTLALERVKPVASGGSIVRFKQQRAGLDVVDAIVTVRLDELGRVLHVASSAAPIRPDLQVIPRLTAGEALHLARASLHLPLPLEERGGAKLVITRGGAGRLAWEVRVTPGYPMWVPVVHVDAITGELLGSRDLAKRAGQGNVFVSGSAAHAARQPDGSFNASGRERVPLAGLGATSAGQHLFGTEIIASNCCVNKDCDPAKPPASIALDIPVGGGTSVHGDVVLCDEKPFATADSNGDFLLDPAKEPVSLEAAEAGPDRGDAFSEVSAFHYASGALAFIRTLDANFVPRQEARPLRVTANFLSPDICEGFENFDFTTFTTHTTRMLRTDNAMYLPAGATDQLGIPSGSAIDRNFDSIVLFQGTKTDFAYDPDVVTHEFVHGVIAATANLGDFSADAYGVIDAPGAMNEGFADYFAAARDENAQIGEYVGNIGAGSGEGTLRDLENTFSCPSLVNGEVHNDSQHFSAALWAARKASTTDSATRKKFDRAVLAALDAITPLASFGDAHAAIALEVERELGATAKENLASAFTLKGVIGCDRYVDLTPDAPHAGFFIAPAEAGRGFKPYAPPPKQFHLTPPKGATKMTIRVKKLSSSPCAFDLPGADTSPNVQAELKQGSPISFTYGANAITSDGDTTKPFVLGNPDPDVVFPIDSACGTRDFYVALENTAGNTFASDSVSVIYNSDPATLAACAPPDAGPDPIDAGSAGSGSDAPAGCGCAGAGPASFLAFAMLAIVLRRGKRSAI